MNGNERKSIDDNDDDDDDSMIDVTSTFRATTLAATRYATSLSIISDSLCRRCVNMQQSFDDATIRLPNNVICDISFRNSNNIYKKKNACLHLKVNEHVKVVMRIDEVFAFRNRM